MTRVGSLFTGYGGLDLAVGGDLAWYSEIEPAACQVLEHHFPGVPNLGDITKIDWTQVEPVDVITGGYPCQPFSHAGNRKGKKDDRHLWPYVREAIRTIRPDYAILENVRGHLTLGLTEVLGEIASIGFNAEWSTFRASEIGAPHRRDRVFIVATNTTRRSGGTGSRWNNSESERAARLTTQDSPFSSAADTDSQGIQGHEDSGSETPSTRQGQFEQGVSTPVADTESNEQRESEKLDELRPELGNGVNARSIRLERGGFDWGKYDPAIRRWEAVLERQAPDPTVVDEKTSKLRLNPVFVEWMMGLPTGWVTGHGLSRAKELKMLGNGVVPQQAREAINGLIIRSAT